MRPAAATAARAAGPRARWTPRAAARELSPSRIGPARPAGEALRSGRGRPVPRLREAGRPQSDRMGTQSPAGARFADRSPSARQTGRRDQGDRCSRDARRRSVKRTDCDEESRRSGGEEPEEGGVKRVEESGVSATVGSTPRRSLAQADARSGICVEARDAFAFTFSPPEPPLTQSRVSGGSVTCSVLPAGPPWAQL
jgi:hypothetical protein